MAEPTMTMRERLAWAIDPTACSWAAEPRPLNHLGVIRWQRALARKRKAERQADAILALPEFAMIRAARDGRG